MENLRDCQPIRIPRCYSNSFDFVDSFQLCGFCDASSSAYAAVVFLLVRRGSEIRVGHGFSATMYYRTRFLSSINLDAQFFLLCIKTIPT